MCGPKERIRTPIKDKKEVKYTIQNMTANATFRDESRIPRLQLGSNEIASATF